MSNSKSNKEQDKLINILRLGNAATVSTSQSTAETPKEFEKSALSRDSERQIPMRQLEHFGTRL
jgi:hypothetical protein